MSDKNIKFYLDILAIALTGLALLFVGFLAIAPDPYLADLAFRFLALSFVGVALGLLAGNTEIDSKTSLSEVFTLGMFGLLTCGLVAIGQVAALFLMGAGAATGLSVLQGVPLYPLLVGVSEELAFAFGLTTLIYKLTKSFIVSSLVRAAFFAVYHLWVAPDPVSLAQFFVSGFILSYMYLASRRVSVSIIGHVLFDALLMGGFF
jgi:membrane protease YdiL (CAAX protease family)